jgi:hypothetical protein
MQAPYSLERLLPAMLATAAHRAVGLASLGTAPGDIRRAWSRLALLAPVRLAGPAASPPRGVLLILRPGLPIRVPAMAAVEQGRRQYRSELQGHSP